MNLVFIGNVPNPNFCDSKISYKCVSGVGFQQRTVPCVINNERMYGAEFMLMELAVVCIKSAL